MTRQTDTNRMSDEMETKAYCSSKPTKRYRSRSGTVHTRLHSLSCPSCGWYRLIDMGNRTVSRTYSPGDPGYAYADYYQKCAHCNEEIGIQKM